MPQLIAHARPSDALFVSGLIYGSYLLHIHRGSGMPSDLIGLEVCSKVCFLLSCVFISLIYIKVTVQVTQRPIYRRMVPALCAYFGFEVQSHAPKT